MKRPNFFIVGAPKCGTTAMFEYLKVHPEIYMSPRKEIHYFGSDLKSNKFKRYRNERIYLSLFAGAQDEKCIGEASPWYLYSQQAAKEIGQFNPASKIIIMLRSPVDMMHSLYYQLCYSGIEDLSSFEQALNAETDRKQGRRIPKTVHLVQMLFYREVAKFSEQVCRYFEVFGRNQVYVIIFDDFKDDTAGTYRKTLNFLEVDPNFQTDLRAVKTNKRLRSPTLRRLIKMSPVWFSGGRNLLPTSFRLSLLKQIKRLNTQSVSRPPMDPDLRECLQMEFRPEVEQLSQLLERDLMHWCQGEPEPAKNGQ